MEDTPVPSTLTLSQALCLLLGDCVQFKTWQALKTEPRRPFACPEDKRL